VTSPARPSSNRRRIAAEELAEPVAVEVEVKKATAELKALVLARGSHLMDVHGVGPVVAARVLADTGDLTRFADRNRFASGARDRTPRRLVR
jgi:transposase